MKSCKSHEKQNKKYQNAGSIDEKLKTKSPMFLVSFLFMWFARFQILICEPAKHFAQASCTEFTVRKQHFQIGIDFYALKW